MSKHFSNLKFQDFRKGTEKSSLGNGIPDDTIYQATAPFSFPVFQAILQVANSDISSQLQVPLPHPDYKFLLALGEGSISANTSKTTEAS